ncbi:hypothetical protein O1L68_15000 [Streptomyces lydicus]|nr:hypothetical protein [Streptomyces lydicus]
MARAFDENSAARRDLTPRLSTRLARAALRAVGPTLESRNVGNALLVHPRGFVDNRALAFSQRLAADPQHTLVVLDLPARPEDDVWRPWPAPWNARAAVSGSSPAAAPARTSNAPRSGSPTGWNASCWPPTARWSPRRRRAVRARRPRAGLAALPAPQAVGPGLAALPKPQWEYSVPDQPWSTGPGGTAEPLPGACGCGAPGRTPPRPTTAGA